MFPTYPNSIRISLQISRSNPTAFWVSLSPSILPWAAYRTNLLIMVVMLRLSIIGTHSNSWTAKLLVQGPSPFLMPWRFWIWYPVHSVVPDASVFSLHTTARPYMRNMVLYLPSNVKLWLSGAAGSWTPLKNTRTWIVEDCVFSFHCEIHLFENLLGSGICFVCCGPLFRKSNRTFACETIIGTTSECKKSFRLSAC